MTMRQRFHRSEELYHFVRFACDVPTCAEPQILAVRKVLKRVKCYACGASHDVRISEVSDTINSYAPKPSPK